MKILSDKAQNKVICVFLLIGSIGLVVYGVTHIFSSIEYKLSSDVRQVTAVVKDYQISVKTDENGNEKTRTRSRETIFTPESKTVSADAMAGDVITIQRESDETLPLLAKIELTVAYYNDKTEIEIRSGKYSIVQIDPLVMYANAWYALMQKDKYVMNYFTESEASYETGWGPTPYDAEKDKWTCGSGMGATITDFINDSTYNFAIDCYIE